MAQLTIDQAAVNWLNQLDHNVYVWTQYQECFECPYSNRLQVPPSVPKQHKFRTFYRLQYLVTSGESVSSPEVCSGTINAQDQSIYDLIINANTSQKCILQVAQEGRNNIWPLLIGILVTLLVAAIFYLARFGYRRWKGMSDGNEELNSKISQRLNSLDAFRGLTILMMIFVNWGAGQYHFLEHAEWDGIQFADFIFPAFIFIMGTTMAISLKNLVIKKDLPLLKVYWNVLYRSIKLFLVGLILNSRGNPDPRYIRIPGVLQRFAISYLLVAAVHILSLHLNKDELYSRISYMNDIVPYWPDWILAFVMLILYFVLTFAWQFDPDCPKGYLGPGGLYQNASHPYCVGGAANKLDKLIFTEKHMYHFTSDLYNPIISEEKERAYELRNDPEGALGVSTSVVLCILGLQVGKIILTYSSCKQRMIRFGSWTVFLGLLTAILAATGAIPINKNLWSFTFVTVNGAVSMIIFMLFYLLIDHFKVWPCGQPFHYPGMNSILLYIGHSFTGGMWPFAYVSGATSHAWPLTQNITGVTIWLLISVYLAKKNIFLTL